jgi:hypothetical protein
VIVVPYIEDKPELCALYKSDVAAFWTRILNFENPDELAASVVFLIVDGAHRRQASLELQLKFMWSRFMAPTMSYGDMVRMRVSL